MENKVVKKMKKIARCNTLVEKYRYLISEIARQFEEIPDSRENLEKAGYLGLLNAAHLYDIKVHKVNFKTYARILITEEMYQYLLDHNRQVERPDWLRELNEQINSFVIKYQEKYQRSPRIDEIASQFNIDDDGLPEILKARDALREAYFSFNRESISKYKLLLKPNLGKIKNRCYQSFKLPIEDLIILRRAFKKIKKIKEDIFYYLFVLDLSQTKLARTVRASSR